MRRLKRRGRKKSLLPWELWLYIANGTASSMLAQDNLRNFCHEFLPQRCDIRIVDVVKSPEAASLNDIVAIPTLVRTRPVPKKTLIGTLSNKPAVLKALSIVPTIGIAVAAPRERES